MHRPQLQRLSDIGQIVAKSGLSPNHPIPVVRRRNGRTTANDPIADIDDACEAPAMIDDHEARFDQRMRKIVKHKPAEKPE